MGNDEERHCCTDRHNTVPDKLESLHPIGHAISHSAMRGFNCRREVGSDGEDVSPGVVLVSSGGPQRKSVACAVRYL